MFQIQEGIKSNLEIVFLFFLLFDIIISGSFVMVFCLYGIEEIWEWVIEFFLFGFGVLVWNCYDEIGENEYGEKKVEK